ncbi:hypothetical protein [Flavobacterium sp.]|uniref:hypothetical protein n=1 Tax=Flavobacterium sp. TaxID=239 RepID=UPI00286E1060|nr:hypothetical protein [Flavobacterium sp.]
MLIFKKQLYHLAIMSVFLLFSCQSEQEEQSYNTQETITKSSPLTSYLQRLTMVKTTEDNLIDNSSYCKVKLPYQVTVNTATIAINSADDYQKVVENINAYSNDNDIVKINFPVTMIYYNYLEKVIATQSDFDSLLTYWAAQPNLLFKINCVKIIFPITINIYNSANQIASSISITNDQVFFNFIKNLNDSQYIAIDYPILLTDNNNHTLSIANNSQLENAIKYALDTCPENINPTLDFSQILKTHSWKISYYYDEYEKTALYNDYVFVFKSDNSATATKYGVTVSGQWETKTENGVTKFRISFSPDLLHELDEQWKVFEFNNSQLRFRKEESSKDNHYLYFEKQ